MQTSKYMVSWLEPKLRCSNYIKADCEKEESKVIIYPTVQELAPGTRSAVLPRGISAPRGMTNQDTDCRLRQPVALTEVNIRDSTRISFGGQSGKPQREDLSPAPKWLTEEAWTPDGAHLIQEALFTDFKI